MLRLQPSGGGLPPLHRMAVTASAHAFYSINHLYVHLFIYLSIRVFTCPFFDLFVRLFLLSSSISTKDRVQSTIVCFGLNNHAQLRRNMQLYGTLVPDVRNPVTKELTTHTMSINVENAVLPSTPASLSALSERHLRRYPSTWRHDCH